MWTAVTVTSTTSGDCQGTTGVLGDLQVTAADPANGKGSQDMQRISRPPAKAEEGAGWRRARERAGVTATLGPAPGQESAADPAGSQATSVSQGSEGSCAQRAAAEGWGHLKEGRAGAVGQAGWAHPILPFTPVSSPTYTPPS